MLLILNIVIVLTKPFSIRGKNMKTKITRKIISGVLAGLMVLSLAACGSKDETAASKSTAQQQSTQEVSTPAPEAKKVTIRMWKKPSSADVEGKIKMYEAFIAKFKAKYPNIELQDDSLKPGTDYRQEYDKALMAGEAPTAVDIFSYTDIPTRIKNGTIAEITDLYNSWDMKDKTIKTFDQAISTKDGKWYAFTKSAYVMGTLYNAKAIKEGGGDPANMPKTWAEFAELGKKLTDAKKPRFGYELVGMDWNAWPFTAWIWAAGGEMVRPNDDGTYKIAFNEDPGVDTAMFWNEMIWKYQMTQKDVLQDWNKLQDDIKGGRACFSWADVSWLNQDELSKYGLQLSDFGFIPMPVKDASIANPTFSGGEVVTFNPKATKDEIEAAWNYFTYYYFDEEVLKEQWQLADQYKVADLQMPARADMYEKKLSMLSAVPESMKKDLLSGAPSAKAEPYCGHWGDLKSTLAIPLQKILLKKDITREECKKILDDCANELYTKYADTFKK